MKKGNLPWLAIAAALALSGTLLIRNLTAREGLAAAPQARAAAPDKSLGAQLSAAGGPRAIHVDQSAQARLSIRTSPLAAGREQHQRTLPATVLPVQTLVSLVASYQAAAAQLQKAQITARVAKQEYERLEKLYRNQRNVSAKALEAQAGIYHGDEVDAQTAQESLALVAASVRQSWGDRVSGWVRRGSKTLQRVLGRQDALVEMTLPLDVPFTAPTEVALDLPAGGRAPGKLVSAFPQADPRVQGVGFLYLTHGQPGLAPGLNLVAHFGVGALATGVVIPSSAVVWNHGRAWAYVATAADRFARREVATDAPEPGGWFVTRGFAAGERVVTRGAEELLAIEPSHAAGSPTSMETGGD